MRTLQNPLMRCVRVAVAVGAFPALGQSSFQNLDFESALIDQAQPPGFVSITDALPGWSVYYGTNQQTQVLFNVVEHGGTVVDLLGANGSSLTDSYRSIQGGFSVLLQGGVIGGAVLYPTPASIRQMGLVPVGSHSIMFKAQPEDGTLTVSLGGVTVPYFALSTGPNYTLYGGDVSAFAGQTVELDLSLSRAPGADYSNLNVDSIEFSASTIPEPSVLTLSALGTVLLTWRFLRVARHQPL